MFERFTDRARGLFSDASSEADLLHCRFIGPEHLLLAMLCDQQGAQAAEVLASLGVNYDVAIRAAWNLGLRGQGGTRGYKPQLPMTQRVVAAAWQEALSLGQNYIGPEHLLLGLLRPVVAPDSDELTAGAQILVHLGHRPEAVRKRTLDYILLANPGLIPPLDVYQPLPVTGLTPVVVMDKLGAVLISAQDLLTIRWASSESTDYETAAKSIASMYENLHVPHLNAGPCVRFALILRRLCELVQEVRAIGSEDTNFGSSRQRIREAVRYHTSQSLNLPAG